MKKQLLLLAFLYCTQLTLFSQYSITGKVLDDNGEPMPGANIVIGETFSGTTSNYEGDFQFKKIKKGTYVISVSFLGYATESKTIKLEADIRLTFQLSPKSYMADEVIVLSTRASDKDPVTYSTITKKQKTGKWNHFTCFYPYSL